MIEEKQKERIGYIDLFRFCGVILMLLTHTLSNSYFYIWVRAFNMPMFYFASGLVFRGAEGEGKGTWDFVKKKAKSLLLPYATIGIFHWAVYVLIYRKDRIKLLKNLLWKNTNTLPIAGALWFLTSLFFCEIIYYFINRLIKSSTIKTVLVCCVGMVGIIVGAYLNIKLPWALGSALVGVVFFHAGCMVKQNSDKRLIKLFADMKWIVWVILLLVNTALIWVNGYVSMHSEEYSNPLLFLFNALLSIILLIVLCKRAEQKLSNSRLIQGCKKIGRNSLIYLGFNQLAILIIHFILTRVGIHEGMHIPPKL